MKELIKFSLSEIDIIKEETEDDGNIDFALARLKFIGTSKDETENSQGYILTEEVLKRDAHTALGKLITGKVNQYSKDLMSHEEDNDIFGYVPPNSKITFEQEGDRWFAICEAVISKIYCRDVVKAFQYNNERCVSIEASIFPSPNTPKEIESFIIHSITILSTVIRGAVKGANMEIIKFSSDKAEQYYNEIVDNPLKKFAEKRKIELEGKSYKINKTELKDTPWGNVDKTALQHKVMNAKNRDTLVHSVYALVEDGWEDAPSEHLKYPIMQESDGTFYYNRYALSSALGYAEKEDETEVIGKIKKLYKKFKLEDSKKEEKMEDEVKLAEDKKEEDIIMGSDEEKEEQVEEGCTLAEKDAENTLDEETKEPQDAKNTEEENKAKWSMDEIGALLADKSVKDTVLGFFSEDSIEGLVSKLVEFAEKAEELKKEKDKVDKEKADAKFSQIMGIAKLKLSDDKYTEMYKIGEVLKFSELDAFEKEVKACIFDTVAFAETVDVNPTVSFGTHLKLTETKPNGLWD